MLLASLLCQCDLLLALGKACAVFFAAFGMASWTGVAAGAMRPGVDPMQLYISIAGLGYFYHSNIHTLSTIFGRDLRAQRALSERRRHVVDVVLGYLVP